MKKLFHQIAMRRSVFTFFLTLAAVVFSRPAISAGGEDFLPILERYFRATYAREYQAAYAHIAAGDQRLKDSRSYVRERGAFTGFTLDVARKLASYAELMPTEKQVVTDRAKVKLRVGVPDANKLSEILYGWDSERLEALDQRQRRALLESIDSLHRAGKLPMVEGEESFDLVKEANGWKVFLDWSSGVRVNFQASIPAAVPVTAVIEQAEVGSRPGGIFKVAVKIKNIGKEPMLARIGHLVDPHDFRDYLDLVDCGFLLPVKLLPGVEEEFVSTYLLRSSLPEGVRRLNVTYAFSAAK
jgi:hypothetical protein